MKALSLWEPWASLMALEAKKVETRSWYTSHRGPLLICAAKRKVDADGLSAMIAAKNLGGFTVIPAYGMAVCIVNVIRCDRIAAFNPDCLEHYLGDYTPGRFAWVTDGLRKIRPFPVRGAQGLFDVDDALIEYV